MIRSIFKYFPVAVIVALFYGFVIVPGTFHKHMAAPARPPEEPVCLMAFKTGRFAAPEIVGWADLDDPTLFALPNYRHGFSAVMNYRLPAVRSPIPTQAIEFVSRPDPEARAAPMTPVRLPFSRVEPKVVGVKRQGQAVGDRVVAPKTMLWMWGDGTMIESPPSITGWLKQLDFSTIKPRDETQVDITNTDGLLRMVLCQSSGSAELDQLVLRALGPVLSMAETPDKETHPRLLGKELPGGLERVRVEWRTLPELNEEGR